MNMIGMIRRLHNRKKKSDREISRMTGLSRNTVAKRLHGAVDGPPKYRRGEQPNKLTVFHEALKQALKADARRPKHERRTAKALYAEIQLSGYDGGYTRVTDFIRAWSQGEGQGQRSMPSSLWRSNSARRTSSTGTKRAWWWAASITACRSRT